MTEIAPLTEHDKRRIRYHCRRGMLENDVQLRPYIDAVYAQLSDEHWRDLAVFLEAPDPDVFNWFMDHAQPDGAAEQRALARIKAFHQRT